ncbi:PREDICTED: double-headed protease inhibitor, submandibular gland-like [Nicrophorus vespilloides]|uniref:Double-headed protease inhibitor, submandibular gland-like n=1 Tax=Nicrophorus vespilloides TaxID=110193 RepID=A0ABM1MG05_NICVS|nr:PREDICTED: double-headed protease inhibitor, submandibular gland-like [Nicrophorus vespilloides]
MMSKLAIAFAIFLSVSVQLGRAQYDACPALWAPVCASNGVTYRNKCLFVHSVHNPDVRILYYGTCEDSSSICTDEFQPICASNGLTYGNKCVFENALKSDGDLQIVFYGNCNDKNERKLKNVVCGSDGVTYSWEEFLKEQARNPSLIAYDLAHCLVEFNPKFP